MKRFILSFLLALMAGGLFAQNEQCDFYIQSSFDSECILTYVEKRETQFDHDQNVCLLACAGSTVTYKLINASTTGVSYEWTISGAENYTVTGSGTIVTVAWPNEVSTGVIEVTATSDENVCSEQVCVEVIEKPIAEITSNPQRTGINSDNSQYIEVCDGQEIQFYSTSTGSAEAPIVGYLWEDGQNAYATEDFTFTADFDSYGEITKVNLTVINECGCEDRQTYFVHISKFPTLKVDCYGTACEGDQVTYTSYDEGCENYIWSLEGGDIMSGQNTPSITVLWNDIQDGYGYLALDALNCNQSMCPSLTYLPIPVMADEVTIVGPEIVCTGDIVSFKLPLWASTEYNWNITGGPMPNVLGSEHPHEILIEFTNPGNYTITADYLNEFLGCSGAALPKHIIVRKPAPIDSESMACAGESINFETDFSYSNIIWSVLDESMTAIHTEIGQDLDFTFNTAGGYTIRAEHPDFCAPSLKGVIINPLPPAPTSDLTTGWETEVCLNSGYLFAAETTEEQCYLHWSASCGIPNAFDGPEFNVTIGSPICDIHLTHIDQITGCASSALVHELEEFHPAPVAWNIQPIVCANSIFPVSINGEDNVLYEWRVINSNVANVVAGQYTTGIEIQTNAIGGTIQLELRRTFCDQTETIIRQIEVGDFTQPDFNLDPSICQNESFFLTPTNIGGGSATWLVNGAAAGGSNGITHIFTEVGTIPVTMLFTNACGQLFEIVHTIEVLPAPVADLSYLELQNGLQLTASIQSSTSNNYTYHWGTWGTGPIVTVPIPQSTTTYFCTITNTQTLCSIVEEIKYVVATGQGCAVEEGTITGSVSCNQAHLSRNNYSGNAMINWAFYGNSSTPTYTTLGTHNQNCIPTFTNTGYYTVSATEFYGNCAHYATEVIAVPLLPNFGVNYICSSNEQVELILTNTSAHMQTANIISTSWNINGAPAGDPCILSSGNYTIEMIVEFSFEGSTHACSIEKSIPVQRADAAFTLTSGPYCAGSPIQFTDQSGNAISWLWTLGNLDQQNLSQHPMQTFDNTSGSPIGKNIVLEVQDAMGCSSTANNGIMLNSNQLRDGEIDAVNGPICSGLAWEIEYDFISGTPANTSYQWFDVMETTNVNANDFFTTGTYYVKLSNLNTGCKHQSRFENICFANRPYAHITGNDSYCSYENIKLYGETGEYTYTWDVPTLNDYSDHNLNLNAGQLAAGIYDIELSITNGICSASDTHSIEVHASPAAPSIAFGNNVCIHEPPVQLKSTNNSSLFWNTGDFSSSTYTYASGFHTAYYLHPTTGCKSDYAYIQVAKMPDFNELMTGCYQFCRMDLPKSILGPTGFFDFWDWQKNSQTLESDNGYIDELSVPDFASYDLTVIYGDGACQTSSETLEISPKMDCDSCDINVTMKGVPKCKVEKCHFIFTIPFYISNLSSTTWATLTSISAPNITILDITDPGTIPAEGTSWVDVTFMFNTMEPPVVNFEMEFFQNSPCIRHFTYDFTEVLENCIDDCEPNPIHFVNWEYVPDGSTSSSSYFAFHIETDGPMEQVEVYSDQVTISSTDYLGVDFTGLFSISQTSLQELVDNEELICLRVYACKGDHICTREFCFKPHEFLKIIASQSVARRNVELRPAIENSMLNMSNFTLYPNPASQQIKIEGKDNVLKRYSISNILGQTVLEGHETEINIEALSTGTYLIKLIDQNNVVQFIKFIKE